MKISKLKVQNYSNCSFFFILVIILHFNPVMGITEIRYEFSYEWMNCLYILDVQMVLNRHFRVLRHLFCLSRTVFTKRLLNHHNMPCSKATTCYSGRLALNKCYNFGILIVNINSRINQIQGLPLLWASILCLFLMIHPYSELIFSFQRFQNLFVLDHVTLVQA